MASYESIGKELECPICLEYLNLPKVMGQCLHSACCECLKMLIATCSKKFFPCPVCRRRCKIPPEGVADLTDDFRLRAIVEKFQEIEYDKSHNRVERCIACPNPASRFCEMCEKIYLCVVCSDKHSQDPLTAGHRLVGLCTTHWKSLTMYCRKCDMAICNVCLVANHPSGSQEHDVILHPKMADEEAAEVVAAVEKLCKTQEQKENALRTITDIRDGVTVTIDSALGVIAQLPEYAVDNTIRKYTELMTKHCSIGFKIETPTDQKSTEKEISLCQRKEEYSQYLNRYRDSYMNQCEEAMTQAAAENEAIKVQIDLGRQETSLKRALDDETVSRLKKIKKELSEASSSAEQKNLLAPFVEEKAKLSMFVPVQDEIELGFKQRRFTTLRKSADIFNRGDRPKKFLNSVRYLPDGRLASLYQTGAVSPNTVSLHCQSSCAICQRVYDQFIFPAQDMVVTSKEELIVLRLAEPAVRVFNSHTGRFHSINIAITKDKIGRLQSIESDGEGNIFVADNNHLRAFNQYGAIIQEVAADVVGSSKMSYSRPTRTLYIANNQNILMYHWDGTMLRETSSFAHGLDGFRCRDICICNDREVFVAGDMDDYSNEIRIYQFIEEEEALSCNEEIFGPGIWGDEMHDFKMIRLDFDDNIKRGADLPTIGVFGDKLALGYGGKLELFELIP